MLFNPPFLFSLIIIVASIVLYTVLLIVYNNPQACNPSIVLFYNNYSVYIAV